MEIQSQAWIGDVTTTGSVFQGNILNSNVNFEILVELWPIIGRIKAEDEQSGKGVPMVSTEAVGSLSRGSQEAWKFVREELERFGLPPDMCEAHRETITKALQSAASYYVNLQGPSQPFNPSVQVYFSWQLPAVRAMMLANGGRPVDDLVPNNKMRHSDFRAVPLGQTRVPVSNPQKRQMSRVKRPFNLIGADRLGQVQLSLAKKDAGYLRIALGSNSVIKDCQEVSTTSSGLTVFEKAVGTFSIPIIQVFLDSGCYLTEPALSVAAIGNGPPEVFARLLYSTLGWKRCDQLTTFVLSIVRGITQANAAPSNDRQRIVLENLLNFVTIDTDLKTILGQCTVGQRLQFWTEIVARDPQLGGNAGGFVSLMLDYGARPIDERDNFMIIDLLLRHETGDVSLRQLLSHYSVDVARLNKQVERMVDLCFTPLFAANAERWLSMLSIALKISADRRASPWGVDMTKLGNLESLMPAFRRLKEFCTGRDNDGMRMLREYSQQNLDLEGGTILHLLVAFFLMPRSELQVLLSSNAVDVNARTKANETALDFLLRFQKNPQRAEFEEMLVRAGAKYARQLPPLQSTPTTFRYKKLLASPPAHLRR